MYLFVYNPYNEKETAMNHTDMKWSKYVKSKIKLPWPYKTWYEISYKNRTRKCKKKFLQLKRNFKRKKKTLTRYPLSACKFFCKHVTLKYFSWTYLRLRLSIMLESKACHFISVMFANQCTKWPHELYFRKIIYFMRDNFCKHCLIFHSRNEIFSMWFSFVYK